MKTLQSITTILLTLMLLVVGTLGFVPQADACECDFALYTDERPSGTNGDSLTVNTWNVRTINTTVIEQGSSISRSGNEITLQPGIYYIHLVAQFHGYTWANITQSKLRLRTTDNQTLAIGHAATLADYKMGGDNQLLTYVTVQSAPITYRIEQYISPNSTGYYYYTGAGSGSGEPEVYLTVRIVKVTSDGCH